MSATITAMVIALVPVFVRISEVGPIATAFYRFFLSFPFLLGWMIVDQVNAPNPRTPQTYGDYLLILGAGAFLAMDIALWHWSILSTTIINATLLNNLTSILVAVVSWLFFKERLSRNMKIGLFFAFIGSAILIAQSFKVDAAYLWGDFLAFLSALFFTAFMISIKELKKTFRSPAILAWGALPTMYLLCIIAYFSGEVFFPTGLSGWWPLLAMAFFVHIFGQGLMTFSMAYLSASLVALIVGLSPAFAAIFAWLIFGESLNIVQIIGAGIVLLGIFVAKRSDTG